MVRVRFAPSPTGLLHVGGLRTALYNYLYARKHGGRFVLRIEDTDRERYVDGAEADILDSLQWAGLDADEGPHIGGDFGPYHQSQRTTHYDTYARQLIEDGHAYYAFDTPEELDQMRKRVESAGDAVARYDASTRGSMRNSFTMSAEEVARRIADGEPHVIRLKVPQNEVIEFEDAVRGRVSFESAAVDDQVLVKSDGLPTYHLANVVDDHLMQITDVIRGEEWLPSAPKHILLYRFFGFEPPRMAHLPLILSPSGGKLSKRNASTTGIPVSVRDYRERGFEPEALLNFLAFLGWNPGTDQELFSLDELVEAFTLERVGSSGVQFNMDKLAWYNQQYVKRRPPAELAAGVLPALKEQGIDVDPSYVASAARLMQERLTFGQDLLREAPYFFIDPADYDSKAVSKRWKADSPELLSEYARRLEALESFTEEATEAALRALAESREAGAGRIIHPVRLAVSGVSQGPGLFELLAVLGKDRVVRRIRRAVEVLG